MKPGAHEAHVEFRHVDPPSDRKFGVTVGGILVAIGAVGDGVVALFDLANQSIPN